MTRRNRREATADLYGRQIDHLEAIAICHDGGWDITGGWVTSEIDWQTFWRRVASAGGCESKAQSVAVKLWINQQRDHSIPLNGLYRPRGRQYRWIADVLNRLGYRTKKNRAWKGARTQQVIVEGITRQTVFMLIRCQLLRRESIDDAYNRILPIMWEWLRMKAKAKKNGVAESCVERPNTIDWAARKEAARARGWKPPDRYWWLD